MPVIIKNLGVFANTTRTQFSFTFPSLEALFSQFGSIGECSNDHSSPAAGTGRVGVGSNGATSFHCLIPYAISGVLGKNQFSQFTLIQNTGTAGNPTRPSLFLFMRGISSRFDNSFTGFRAVVVNTTPSIEVQTTTSYNPTGSATILSIASAVNNNDVLRFEGRRVAGPNIELTVLINGSIVGTVNSAVVPSANVGLPGWGCGINPLGGGVLYDIGSFSCGAV